MSMSRGGLTLGLYAKFASCFACPVCAEPLGLDALRPHVLVCGQGHCFDIAREGYVNLLLSSQRRSSQAGYAKAMLDGRRALFEQGFFGSLVDAVYGAVADNAGAGNSLVLDAGCGEGSVLTEVCARGRADVRALCGFGLDISKQGVRCAAKQDAHSLWCVANLRRRLPFQAGTFGLVLNVLSPGNWAEFHRVLAPGGVLIKVAAAEDHLQQYRDAIYEAGRTEALDDSKAVADMAEQFDVRTRRRVTYTVPMNCAATGHLIAMSPLTWKGKRDRIEAVREAGLAEVTVDVSIVVAVTREHA